jgi:hypothetical protein
MRNRDASPQPPARCPWGGALGPEYDESPLPADICGHDPAQLIAQPGVPPFQAKDGGGRQSGHSGEGIG